MGVSIVVTDAEQRSALAVVRSLGRAGHAVHVCGSTNSPLAGASRYAASIAKVPDPLDAPTEFALAVARIAEERGASVILPVGDAAILAILREPERFEKFLLPFPRDDRFSTLCDKGWVLRRAEELGIAVPRQVVIATAAAGADSAVALELDFPVVVKPSRSVFSTGSSRVKEIVSHAGNPQELRARLAELHPASYPVLVQERVRGPGVGVFILIWNGELHAAFSHRRIREKPPWGGVCVLGESRPLEAELLERSVALVTSFGWSGVAMVEYKYDEQRGIPYLMEVNPRFWGSLQLSIDAGVDFPRILVDLLLGVNTAPVLSFPAGVRMRWFWGDVDNLLVRIRRRNGLPLEGAAAERGVSGAVADFLQSFGGSTREEVFRRSDLAPFVRESWNWIRGR